MNIEDKLALSGRSGVISFIREGMFYRCYQQSLFLYLTQCEGKIKILGKCIKKLEGQRVFYGGFPLTQLSQRYPHAVLTEWGAEIQGEWTDEGYMAWYEACTVSLISETSISSDDGDLFTLSQQMRNFYNLGNQDVTPLRLSQVLYTG